MYLGIPKTLFSRILLAIETHLLHSTERRTSHGRSGKQSSSILQQRRSRSTSTRSLDLRTQVMLRVNAIGPINPSIEPDLTVVSPFGDEAGPRQRLLKAYFIPPS